MLYIIAGTEKPNQYAITTENTESTERTVPVLPLFRVFRAFSGLQIRLPKINFEFWDRFSIIKVALAHPAASNGVCSRHRSKLRKRKQ